MNLIKKYFGMMPTFYFIMRKNTWPVTNNSNSCCNISKLVLEYVGTEQEVEMIETAIRTAISNKGK